MKKKNLFAAILFVAFVSALVSTKQAYAQENNDTLVLLIWVQDALGNKDSVWIYAKNGASGDFVPENLYGVPIESELSIRIIQRTDTNLLDTSYFQDVITGITPYWLVGTYASWWVGPGEYRGDSWGWLSPYPENVDYKKIYDPAASAFRWKFAFHIYAKNLPIRIWTDTRRVSFPYVDFTLHNFDDGTLFKYDRSRLTTGRSNHLIYGRVNDPKMESNDIIVYAEYRGHYTAIQDSTYYKMLYPNPTNNYVVLDDALLTSYNLIDNTGSIVKTFSVETIPFQLDVRNLPAGNYFIVDANKTVFYKFIKEAR